MHSFLFISMNINLHPVNRFAKISVMHNISLTTVLLLTVSNLVMSYAWYGHLRSMGDAPLWKVIIFSWLIALFEYCAMIPANRIGSKTMSLQELKITQEAISLLVFVPFSLFVMKSPLVLLDLSIFIPILHQQIF